MTVRTSTSLHFHDGDLGHRHAGEYDTLDITDGGNSLYLHFRNPGQVDRVIAELLALRAEMTGAPVITCSERDCDQQNPDGLGEWCYKGGEHTEHRDANGGTWTTAASVAS